MNLLSKIGFLILLGSSCGASVKYAVQGDGSLSFLAMGRPSMIHIKGQSKGPKGVAQLDGKKVTGKFTVDLRGLDTGIDMRTSHMKEKYLEVEKYPEAVLTIDDLTLTDVKKSGKLPFKGTLSFHNENKPVEGSFSSEEVQGGIQVHSEMNISISDFKIPVPTYLGITVADKVQIEMDFKLVSEK